MDSGVVRTYTVSSGGDFKVVDVIQDWSICARTQQVAGRPLAFSWLRVPLSLLYPRLVPLFSSLGCPLRAFVL